MAFIWLLGGAIAIVLVLVGLTWAGIDEAWGSGGGPGLWLAAVGVILAVVLAFTKDRALKDRWPN